MVHQSLRKQVVMVVRDDKMGGKTWDIWRTGSFLETKILKRSQGGLVTDIAHPGFTYPDKNLLQLVLALNRFSLKETVC